VTDRSADLQPRAAYDASGRQRPDTRVVRRMPAGAPGWPVGGMSVGVLRDTMVAIGLVLLLPLVVIVIGAPVVLLVRLLLAIFE
jgi:hypothetical protein